MKKESNTGYFLEADVQYPEKLHDLQNDLPFLPERMKIENVEKLLANLLDKNYLLTYLIVYLKMSDDRDIKLVTTEKRSKLSQNKICHRKVISNRNEEETKQNNKNKKNRDA